MLYPEHPSQALKRAVIQVEQDKTTSILTADPDTTIQITADLGMEQRKDSRLKQLMVYLPEEVAQDLLVKAEQFTILDELLYKIDPKMRAAIPQQLRKEILE